MAAEDWIDFDTYDEQYYMEQEPCEVYADKVVHETNKAILFGVGDKGFWVPKSICSYTHTEEGHGLVVVVPRWFSIGKIDLKEKADGTTSRISPKDDEASS